MPFYKALDYITNDDIYAFDFILEHQSTGQKYEDVLWHYPRTGIGYSRWTLGNNDVLGNAHTLYSAIMIPFGSRRRTIMAGIRPSAGIAYLPLIFDVSENHLNRAIGSKLNIYMNMSVDCYITLYRSLELVLDAGLTHFSNGKTRSPNYGINLASMSAGLYYHFQPESEDLTTDFSISQIPPIPKKYIHSVNISAGPKVYDDLKGNRYLSTTFSYSLERSISHSGRAGIGADFFYDGSIKEGLNDEGNPNAGFHDLVRFGIHASGSLQYRRTIAGLQAGYYLYSKYKVLTSLYTRISLHHQITERITAGVCLRSHFGKADSFEYGIGYTW